MSTTWELLTLREYARKRSGIAITQMPNDDVDVIINRNYRSVLPLDTDGLPIEGFGTITTVIGQGEYTIETETIRIAQPITLDDGEGLKVKDLQFYLDPAVFFKRFPEDESVDDSVPRAVMLYGNENSTGTDKDNLLYVRPKPDAVYTIKFANTTRPKELILDSDILVDDDAGYWIGVKTAMEMLDVTAGGSSDRKNDLERDLKTYEGNLDVKQIKQMTDVRSIPGF